MFFIFLKSAILVFIGKRNDLHFCQTELCLKGVCLYTLFKVHCIFCPQYFPNIQQRKKENLTPSDS